MNFLFAPFSSDRELKRTFIKKKKLPEFTLNTLALISQQRDLCFFICKVVGKKRRAFIFFGTRFENPYSDQFHP